MRKDDDPEILQAALLGYQQQLQTINARIAELKRHLGGRSAAPARNAHDPRAAQKKHRISAEGRARIAAAQRKRWAATKKRAS
jgi:hypothetical protein